MTKIEPPQLGPQDFEECFRGEPALPDVTGDLTRGRRRRRRRAVLVSGAVTAVAAVAGVGLALTGSSTQTAVPIAPSVPPPSVSVPSPFPSWTIPTSPEPSEPAPSAGADSAPPLKYSKTEGYLDRNGKPDGLNQPAGAFAATTKHTYELVRLYLDPDREHLGAYDKYGFSGGGGPRGIEVGQKLSWKVDGDPGEGMLLVSVTRAAPGKRAATSGDNGNGLCAGTFGDASCKPTTVDGHQVFLDRQAGGAFVVDYVQPDGELASAWVDPLFANNTATPLRKMDVSLSDVVRLLAEPDLDVIG